MEQNIDQDIENAKQAKRLKARILSCKTQVIRWTRTEEFHLRNMRPGPADGARKILLMCLEKLDALRKELKNIEEQLKQAA